MTTVAIVTNLKPGIPEVISFYGDRGTIFPLIRSLITVGL